MVRQVLAGFLALAAAGGATAGDSAVTASRSERERAEKLRHHAEVVGNEDLGSAGGSAVLGLAGPSPAAGATPTAAESSAPVDGDATPTPDAAAIAASARLEALEAELEWRERMAGARARIAELKQDIAYAQQRLLVLRLGLVVPLDGMAEHNRKPDIDAQMARVADLERELVAARLVPLRIREEARRKRIPPGWVR